MKKIRIGNDFVFAWEIERSGLPENLSSVLEKHLYLYALGKRVELIEGVDYDITGNVIRIEVTPTIANILGTYKAEFHYILPDIGLIDEDRKCAVDVDAFVIVNSTAQADEPSEFTVTSDMAIAFKGDKGDKGDSFTYADFTPEQIAELQQPATDAIASIQEVELAVETAEGLRVQAELNRQTNTSTAILNAEQATDDANNAAILANEKAGLAATATTEANTARDEANLAATAANTKAGEANTAAMAANTAAGLADTKIIEMDTLMSGYDSRVVNLETGKVDKQTFADIATVKIKNIIRNGNFSNGTTYFSSTYATLTAEDNILTATITAISTRGQAFIKHSLQNESVVGNKYYITIDVQPKYDGQSSIYMGGASSGYDNPSMSLIGMQWNSKSVVLTASTVYGWINFYSDFDKTGYVVGDVVKFKNWMCVNLTSTFGAGNEPTKEEMDTLVGILGVQYFEGEITLTQKQIMNWQLKMIRQNRNAIIALGGTII